MSNYNSINRKIDVQELKIQKPDLQLVIKSTFKTKNIFKVASTKYFKECP